MSNKIYVSDVDSQPCQRRSGELGCWELRRAGRRQTHPQNTSQYVSSALQQRTEDNNNEDSAAYIDEMVSSVIENIVEDLYRLKSTALQSNQPRSPLYRAIDCPQCNCPCDCDSTTCNSTVHTAKQLNLISQDDFDYKGSCRACCQGSRYRQGQDTLHKHCHTWTVDFSLQASRCKDWCFGL